MDPSRYGDLGAVEFCVFVNPRVSILAPGNRRLLGGMPFRPGLTRVCESALKKFKSTTWTLKVTPSKRCFSGFAATVVQHEFDHLIGKLYIDHIEDPSLLSFEAEFERFHLAAND